MHEKSEAQIREGRQTALRFVVLIGILSFFADFVLVPGQRSAWVSLRGIVVLTDCRVSRLATWWGALVLACCGLARSRLMTGRCLLHDSL